MVDLFYQTIFLVLYCNILYHVKPTWVILAPVQIYLLIHFRSHIDFVNYSLINLDCFCMSVCVCIAYPTHHMSNLFLSEYKHWVTLDRIELSPSLSRFFILNICLDKRVCEINSSNDTRIWLLITAVTQTESAYAESNRKFMFITSSYDQPGIRKQTGL